MQYSFSDDQSIWAVVPAKGTEQAKQRLAAVLSANERRGFFQAMLADVLHALTTCHALTGIVVVTSDAAIAGLATHLGVRVIEDKYNAGHTAAVNLAIEQLCKEQVFGMVTLPGDIPLLSPAEIEQLIASHDQLNIPAITIAPAHDQQGSNAILCSPPDALSLRFGDNSFFPHLERARQQGIEPQVITLPGIGLDIDHLQDLMRFIERPSNTHAYRYLLEHAIVTRLQENINKVC